MEVIISGFGLVAIIVLANWLQARGQPWLIRAFHWLLFLLNGPLLLFGLLLLIIPEEIMAEILAAGGSNLTAVKDAGLTLALMALWGLLVSLTPVRKGLARWLPLNPGSPVHTLALVFAGYLGGQSALTLGQSGLEGLADSAEATSLGFFVLSELLFALVALLGIGYLVRRDGRETMKRLGLERLTARQFLIGAVWIVVLVILQGITGVVWSVLYPEQADVVNDLNTRLLGNMDTIWEWLVLAVAAGVGEELLFRGALQPVLGIGFTSVLFGLLHIQYGFTPILLFIVVLAVILGRIRRRHNTTMAIYIHAGYNFLLGLFALLATFLERLVALP